MTHQYAHYWDAGLKNVPHMTGASDLLDARDVPIICERLGLTLPFGDVLDVGCGTGRLSKHVAGRYLGADIALSAVEYCEQLGRRAVVISGAQDLADLGMHDIVVALSVFTHIDEVERGDYLDAFEAPRVLVDIIPGDGSGDVALWTAVPEQFERQLSAHGWSVQSWTDMAWGTDGVTHRYYHLVQKAAGRKKRPAA